MKLFKHLFIYNGALVADHSIEEIDDGPKGRDVVHRMRMLVEASGDLFAGSYPFEAPYFDLGGELPWFDQYHRTKAGKHIIRLPLRIEEMAAIAKVLRSRACDGTEGRRSQYCDELNQSVKGKVQGAAVETLLHADAFFERVVRKDWMRSLLWLTAANEAFTTALCAAQVSIALTSRS